jgi:outer membrane biosynthesis protein TonB
VLRCPDLTTLRQWIVERRIARDDEISRTGQRFRRLGSVVEFESLFYSAEQERTRRRTTGQFAPTPAPSAPSGAASAPRLTPVPAPVATTPGAGAPSPRPTPVPSAQGATSETKKPEPVESKKPEPVESKKPEPAVPAAASAAPEKKPAEPAAVGTVKVTPPTGLAASSGGLSPMRLARKDPNRGKPQAMPGMAGSVQAAMRAAGTAPAKAAPAASSEAKRPEPAAAPSRPASAAQPRPAPAAAPGKPVSGGSAAAASSKGASATSGAQTALFSRQEKEDEDDADVTRKLPPADSRATERQPARPRDAVEDAILRNDPVPRHLKEAAEGGDTIRKAPADADSADSMGRPEGGPRGRSAALLVLAVAIIGGGIWYYSQRSETADTPSGQQTAPAGDSTAAGASGTTAEPGSATTAPTPTPPKVVVEPLPPAPATQPSGAATPPPGPAAVPAPPEPTQAAKPEPAKPEPAKPEPAKPEPAKPAAVKPEPAKPEPAKPAAVKPEPAKPEPAKPSATPPATAPASSAPATTAAAKPTISLDELRKKIGEDIPRGFDDQMELAQRLVERYKYDSAQALYEYMLTYASAVPAIHNGLGTCAFEKNRGDEAIQHYRDALERRPNYSAAVFGLAKTYHRLKNDKDQALTYYKKYLELSPKGSAAAIARDSIAKLEGQPPPAPPAPPAP